MCVASNVTNRFLGQLVVGVRLSSRGKTTFAVVLLEAVPAFGLFFFAMVFYFIFCWASSE
jgi:hypothetical protein